ncbi:MAG: putative ammonium transporter [Methanoregula sp. PtaU1.Bin006]|nr:MAG: putative ammonium transporter [Methanoregula sp. PtaB.Bin085]OPY36942.1 MAG: putative ammonium transporter [Methanoregula sp. PtaU1.Bin006]
MSVPGITVPETAWCVRRVERDCLKRSPDSGDTMTMDTGVTCWLMVSALLVMLMTPGVGLFYGGLVRKKNFISMIALSFVSLALASIHWVLIGYSLAFGPDIGGIIGDLDFLGLSGVSADAGSGMYPQLVFMVFQLFFAAVTITIVTSAVAERIKLSSYIVFCLAWLTVVYCPLAHWAWGGGWAQQMGLIDFAGGTVVEICSGFAALGLACVIGRRAGYGKYALEPHNIPIALVGAALLWFGWFGFNAGSALAVNSSAAVAFVNTNSAAAAGTLTWMFASWYRGKPSSLGMVSGAIAGMVAITPAAGFVTPLVAIFIGAVAGVLCYFMMLVRIGQKFDESLDAWAIHGMGGLWGTLATGLFAVAAFGGYTGLFGGNPHQFFVNALAAGVAVAYAFCMTYLVGFAIDRTLGLRVTEDEEYVGLDICQHGERA